MRKIEAVLDPDQLDEVKEALGLIGVRAMTAVEVKGGYPDPASTTLYRGSRFATARPKIRLEIVVDDCLCDAVVRRIVVTANRQRRSDPTIAVLPVHDAIRIRTGERGPDAL
jgi:nitrogen regulatory protein P-II 1